MWLDIELETIILFLLGFMSACATIQMILLTPENANTPWHAILLHIRAAIQTFFHYSSIGGADFVPLTQWPLYCYINLVPPRKFGN